MPKPYADMLTPADADWTNAFLESYAPAYIYAYDANRVRAQQAQAIAAMRSHALNAGAIYNCKR